MSLPRDQLEALCATNTFQAIPPEVYIPVLTSPPFVPTNSLVNLRDTGLVPGSILHPGRVYRCGTLRGAAKDPDAQAWLAASVKRIFDLRTQDEREKSPDTEIKGVENVWLPTQGVYTDPDIPYFMEHGGKAGWKRIFTNIMDVYRPIYRAVLEHVRDRPAEPILIHCTAGRDRTGALSGLLHALAGSPHDAAALDYMLSRVGTEPAREELVRHALEYAGVTSTDAPGLAELTDLRPEYFGALGEVVAERYGGWEGYVTEGLGMSSEDLETVKRNLRVAE